MILTAIVLLREMYYVNERSPIVEDLLSMVYFTKTPRFEIVNSTLDHIV